MEYIAFRTRRTGTSRPGGLLLLSAKVMIALAAGFALVLTMLIGFFIVLPLLLIGGLAFYLHLRRRVRQMRSRPRDGVIDAEYTVIDRR